MDPADKPKATPRLMLLLVVFKLSKVAALSDCLMKVGQLALDLRDELASLDINPLKVLAAGEGVKVVDALAVLQGRSAEK
jgi:hypothetical protein